VKFENSAHKNTITSLELINRVQVSKTVCNFLYISSILAVTGLV